MERLFPIFLKLAGRRVLVVGAGKVAEGKIESLLETGASIHVIAPRPSERVQEWGATSQITLEGREFRPTDLDGVFIVIVATSSTSVNKLVYREAQRRGVLCNVVDVPDQCDFFYPAVVRRGDLQIAISTSGQSPSLAQKIRRQLEKQYGKGYAAWVAELGATRREVLNSSLDSVQKRFLLQSLASREALEAQLSKNHRLNAKGEQAA